MSDKASPNDLEVWRPTVESALSHVEDKTKAELDDWVSSLLAVLVEQICKYLNKAPIKLPDFAEVTFSYAGRNMKIRVDFDDQNPDWRMPCWTCAGRGGDTNAME